MLVSKSADSSIGDRVASLTASDCAAVDVSWHSFFVGGSPSFSSPPLSGLASFLDGFLVFLFLALFLVPPLDGDWLNLLDSSAFTPERDFFSSSSNRSAFSGAMCGLKIDS